MGVDVFPHGMVVILAVIPSRFLHLSSQEASGVGLQIPRPVPPHGEELSAAAQHRAAVAAALQRVLTEPQFTEMAQQIGTKLRQVGVLFEGGKKHGEIMENKRKTPWKRWKASEIWKIWKVLLDKPGRIYVEHKA